MGKGQTRLGQMVLDRTDLSEPHMGVVRRCDVSALRTSADGVRFSTKFILNFSAAAGYEMRVFKLAVLFGCRDDPPTPTGSEDSQRKQRLSLYMDYSTQKVRWDLEDATYYNGYICKGDFCKYKILSW